MAAASSVFTRLLSEERCRFLGGPGSGNPNQGRDSHGRWTSAGGPSESDKKKKEAEKKVFHEIAKGIIEDTIEQTPPLSEDEHDLLVGTIGRSTEKKNAKEIKERQLDFLRFICAGIYAQTQAPPEFEMPAPAPWLTKLFTDPNTKPFDDAYNKLADEVRDLVADNPDFEITEPTHAWENTEIGKIMHHYLFAPKKKKGAFYVLRR